MIIRLFIRVARLLFFAIIAMLLLFCILFAILQTKWAKEQIKEKITTSIQETGIKTKIEGLDGQMPFTWTIQQIDLELQSDRRIILSNLKFRFAILPLLRGRLSVNYLNVENAEYFFVTGQEPMVPLNLERVVRDGKVMQDLPFPTAISTLGVAEAKKWLKEELSQIRLPFTISLNHFAIQHLNLINLEDKSSFAVGISGIAKVQKDLRDFFLDLSVFSPDENMTYLEAFLYGSQKLNFIDTKFKINAFSVDAELKLTGPWSTWEEILYDLPRTKAPLAGESKGVFDKLHLENYPLFERTWKFKTQFSLSSTEEINIQSLSLWSNLFGIKGKAHLFHDIEKSKALFAFSMPDLSLLPSIAKIQGSGKGKVILQNGNFKSSFETHRLMIDTFTAGTLRGHLNGRVDNSEWEAEVKLLSTDASIPFDSSFTVQLIPDQILSIINFKLNAVGSEIHGFIDYKIAEHLFEGSFFANIDNLDKFGPTFGEDLLSGQIAAEIVLSTDDKKQNAKGSLTGKNMGYRQILLDDLLLNGEIKNLFQTPEGRLSFLAEKVFTPSFFLDRLNFGTHFDEIHWPFYLDAQGRIENTFECFAQGFWQKENALFSLELTRLFGELSETAFELKYPCQLEWGSNDLNISPFDFHIGDGNLLTSFELSPIRSVGSWELNHFPLEVLSCIRPRFGLNGLVSSKGFIDATLENIEGACNAVLEDAGVLHFGKKEAIRARGSLQAHINHQLMQLHTTLSATDAQFLDFSASLPIQYSLYPFNISLDRTKNTAAELLAEGKLQDLFDFVNLGFHHFTGLLSCHLFLSQTLTAPSLHGQLNLQSGTYENYFTGINLKNIDALFEAHNEQIQLSSLKANDDKSGNLSATGKIDLKPKENFPYAFEAEMHNLHAVGFDMIDCDLTGPVYFTGNTYEMDAQGNLIVEEAKIQITERLPYEIPNLPVTYINTPKYLISKATSDRPGFQFHIDLELTAENNIRVEGKGLNAELEGNVHLHGTNTNIAANGDLKLIKGEYIFAGKVFKLTEGQIIFKDKPTSSSYLNLSGTLTMPDITITAMMRGALTSPQLTFQSNPQKPTSSILALILFNKDITEINHPEAIQLASTLVSLSGGAGPDVLESIRKSIGIDRLNITSKPGTDELAVQIGKYLTRGIMITLSQSATSSQVIVEVELPKGFVFQAETQEEEEGKFSLKWRKTY